MRTLVLKELRGMRLFIGLGVACALVVLASLFLTDAPDGAAFSFEGWSEWTVALEILILCLGVATGTGSINTERESGTIRFLASLPLSPLQIYAAKNIAVALVLVTTAMLVWGFALVTFALGTESDDNGIPWGFVGVQLGLTILLCLYSAALGTSLFALGRWVPMAMGIAVAAIVAIAVNKPELWWLLPTGLLNAPVGRSGIKLPWEAIGFHTAVLFTSFGAGLLWFRRISRPPAQVAWRRFVAGGLFLVLTPAAWITAIVVIGKALDSEEDEPESEMELKASDGFGRALTDNYEILYLTRDGKVAGHIFRVGDSVHSRVARYFKAPSRRDLIVVDLAGDTVSHASGQAFWKRVVMPAGKIRNRKYAARVLAHETVHVYIDELSDSAAHRNFERTRFYHEGLATHLETLVGDPDADMLLQAARASRLGADDFPLIVKDSEFGKTFDSQWVYPLGAFFCQAIEEVYGREAHAQIVRRMADAAGEKNPVTWWRRLLAGTGYDLERILARWQELLKENESRHGEILDSLPEVSVAGKRMGGNGVLTVEFEGTAPGELLLAVTGEDPGDQDEVEYLRVRDGAVTLPRGVSRSAEVHVNPCWKVGSSVLAGRWKKVAID